MRFFHQERCRVHSSVIVGAWDNDIITIRASASGGKLPDFVDMALIGFTAGLHRDLAWSDPISCMIIALKCRVT